MPAQQPHWPQCSLAEATARLTAPGARFEMADAVIGGIPMKVWKHAPATARALFDGFAAHGDRECLVHEDMRVGYTGFAHAVTHLAAQLCARGIKKGDRIALVMRNMPQWPVAFLAGLLCGAILVPLNARWTAAELGFALDDCDAAMVICDGERAEVVRAAAPHRPLIVAGGQGSENLESLIGTPESWSRLAPLPLPAIALSPEDDATIFYTSGTTGTPKGALGTHRNLTTNIFATPFSSARNALRAGTVPPAPDRRRAILIVIPFFHVSACMASLLPSLYAGGKIVTMRKFEADAALALMEDERITIAGGVPSVPLALLDSATLRSRDLSALELLSYGGAPSPAPLAARIAQALPQAAPGNAWGMTETSATHTIHSARDYLARPESCGPALPVSSLKVMRDGRILPPGEAGELWAFGPNIVKGYWNRPAETAAAFQDGWVRTGDIAVLDEDGFCTILDRAKDMVIRGGENIHCIEVEQVLAQHPQVIEAALVGLADARLGEVPAAMVCARGTLDAAELRAFAGQRLAPFKLPVKIVIGDAPLPRNEGGKVMKAALKAMLA